MQSKLPGLMNEFSNLILAVENDCDSDPMWQRFYQLQMARFIIEKHGSEMIIDEALAAYDRINETWQILKKEIENSDIPLRNPDNIYNSIFIDFSLFQRQLPVCVSERSMEIFFK